MAVKPGKSDTHANAGLPAAAAPQARHGGALRSVVVGRKGAVRFRDGLPFVYRADVQAGPTPDDAGPVQVSDERGRPLGVALWGRVGAVALRRLGPPGTPVDAAEWTRRMDAAVLWRDQLFPGVAGRRLFHAEADDLPGLLCDQHGSALTVQTTCAAAEMMLPMVVPHLVKTFSPSVVVRRDDGSARDMEELPRVKEVLHGSGPTTVRYLEGKALLEVDLMEGHKTGTFLDQRDNHVLAGEVARGRALDLFSCEGGFGLQMALRAEHVVCVEQDPRSIARMKVNVALNNLGNRVDVRESNAFDQARTLDESGARFDTVVVDPPALAKRQGPLENALRGYFELNRRALRMCTPGAFMFTFSCSGRVTLPHLLDLVEQASAQCGRRAQVLRILGAGADHPGLVNMLEATYLKGLMLRVF